MNFKNGFMIKEVREKKSMKKTELAKLVNVSSTYIAQLEKGVKTNPSIDILVKIAKSLDIDIASLVDEKIDTIEVLTSNQLMEKIINNIYLVEINDNVYIYNNKDIDLILSVDEFNLLKVDLLELIKNRIEFIDKLKKASYWSALFGARK